jgi:hypothetical protein
MAFSTAGSSESALLASERLDDSELASSPGGICFRRFQKKHISLGSFVCTVEARITANLDKTFSI